MDNVRAMFVFKAAVVGAGTMGGQIAQTIAAAGIPVELKDIRQDLVDAGLAEARTVTEGQVARLVKKGRLTEEQAAAQVEEVLGRIHGTTAYDGFGDVDFVIEAVPERMAVKQAVFAELDAVTPGHAILASNTSSLSITEIGEATLRPDQVVGFHYFYPASVMPLVEVVQGDDTSTETLTTAVNFAQAIKKQPIACGEVPGFVVNRILMSGMAEVWRAQEERGLSIRSIDEAITGQNVTPAGPFLLTDLLGLDTVLHVAEHLEESYGPERFYVHQGIKALVADGKLGAKTGGVGAYADGEPNLPGDGEADGEELAELLALKSFVEASLLLEEGVAQVRDIDVGMMAGAGLDPRRGLLPPFMRADVLGLDVVLEKLEAATERHGERFAPPTTLRRLVAQGRLGTKSGQGYYAYPQPDADELGAADPGRQARDPRRRGDRLAGQRPDERDRPPGHRGPRQGVGAGQARRRPRARGGLGQPAALLRGRRHQGLHADGRGHRAPAHHRRARAAARARGRADPHDRGRQRPRLRRRLRARHGLRRAPRRALRALRPARGQARDHPRLRRHPAPAAPGGREQGPGDEPHRRGRSWPTRRSSSGWPTGSSTTTSSSTRRWRGRAGWPGRRRWPSRRSRRSPPPATSTRGSWPSRPPSPGPSPPRTRRRASPPSSASGRPSGTDADRAVERLADLVREAGSVVALTGAGISVPSGIPDFRSPGTGPVGGRRPDGGRPHRRLAREPGALLALLRRPLRRARRTSARTARTRRSSSSSAAATSTPS